MSTSCRVVYNLHNIYFELKWFAKWRFCYRDNFENDKLPSVEFWKQKKNQARNQSCIWLECPIFYFKDYTKLNVNKSERRKFVQKTNYIDPLWIDKLKWFPFCYICKSIFNRGVSTTHVHSVQSFSLFDSIWTTTTKKKTLIIKRYTISIEVYTRVSAYTR